MLRSSSLLMRDTTTIFERLMDHRGVSSGSGEKNHPVSKVGRTGDQGIVEVEAVQLRRVVKSLTTAAMLGSSSKASSAARPEFGLPDRKLQSARRSLAKRTPDGLLIVNQEHGGHRVSRSRQW